MARPLSPDERGVLEVLLRKEFGGRIELAAQLEQALAEPIPESPPSIRLVVDRTLPLTMAGTESTDGFGYDREDISVGITLFVRDGYAHELDFWTPAGEMRHGVPIPKTVTIADWQQTPGMPPGSLYNANSLLPKRPK